MTVTVR